MRQLLCPRIVGRGSELRTVVAAIEAAREGRGGCLVVLGEAGVGKSRVAREAERMSHSRGVRVLRGRGVDGGSTIPYRPLAEALLAGLRQTGPPIDRPELGPYLKILARLVPEWREAGAAPREDSLVLLSEAVLRLLRAMAADRGCLLVLEDLHWADSETLAVLEYLTANASTEPLLIVATCRSDERSAALALARTFQSQRLATILDLERLTPAGVRDMASACLNGAAVPEAVDRLLDASAEGLPLLVEDLLAEWASDGALIEGDDGWQVGHVIGPVVPMSFAETVRRRLGVLGGDATRLLCLAALLGRQFDWTLLPAASGLEDDRVLALLHAAVDAQLLRAEPGGLRFRHALTHAAVLQELLPVERARHAARLLELVETAQPDLQGEWGGLAAALAETAGDRRTAARLLLRSGRTALAQGALATAEATLRQARGLAPPELGADIDEALLQVLSEAGKPEPVFELGAALLRALADSRAPALRLARVHLQMARVAVAGAQRAEAAEHLDQARQLDVEGELMARIDALAANAAIDERRTDDADRLARMALAAAERLGEPEVACEALVVIGRLARAYDLERAEAAFERAHGLADSHGLTIWRCRALHELGTIDMFRDCSPRRLLQARELAIELGALDTAAWVDGELAAVYDLRFELDKSLEAALRALEAGRRFRLPGIEFMGLIFAAEVYAFRQDRAAMESLLVQLPQSDGGDAEMEHCAWQFRATLSLIEEHREQALRDFETAMAWAERLPVAAPSPAFGAWAFVRTLQKVDAAAARARVRASWAMAQPVNRGLLLYADAIELGRQGQGARATGVAADGDRILVHTPFYLHLGRRLMAEAAIQDGWGEPTRWLREAEAFCVRHGYEAIASACWSLLRKCGVRPTSGRSLRDMPEPFGSRGVTQRELEVLVVLTDGLSNKEIGVRLYLSPKTVEKHVANLMDKLEVRTRTQLAALATANMGEAARVKWGNSRP
jgi:DNA-binding CsgD family transcriptional regulator/tetratricopeptide (TPR) repeat protein